MRAILEERQAQFEERLERLEQVQEQQADSINHLVETVGSAVAEMREGFNKLISANQLTNSLIEKPTILEAQKSRLLTVVEQQIDKLD